MKILTPAIALIASAGAAVAHEGHVAPVNGHAHGEVLALIIAGALAIAIYALGRRA